MKRRDRFILIAKILVTVLLVVGLFTLLIFALLKQFDSYGGSGFIPKIETWLKFLFLGLAALLPVILMVILIVHCTGNHRSDMVTFEYLDVDFKEKRKKLFLLLEIKERKYQWKKGKKFLSSFIVVIRHAVVEKEDMDWDFL